MKSFPDDLQRAAGFIEGVSGTGIVLGPALGSALYTLGGFPTPFFFCAGVFLCCSMLVFKLIPESVETSEQKHGHATRITYWTLIKNRRVILAGCAAGVNIF